MKDLIMGQMDILEFLRERKLGAPMQHVMPVLEAFIVGDGKKTSKALDSLINYWNDAFENIEKNHVTENKVLYEAADDRKRQLRKAEQELKFLRPLYKELEYMANCECVYVAGEGPSAECSERTADPCPPCYASSIIDRVKKKEVETADTEPVELSGAHEASKDFLIESLKKENEDLKAQKIQKHFAIHNLLEAVTALCTKSPWDRSDVERLKDRYAVWEQQGKPGHDSNTGVQTSDKLSRHLEAKLDSAFRKIDELDSRLTALCQSWINKENPEAVTINSERLRSNLGSLQSQVDNATQPEDNKIPRIVYGGPEDRRNRE